MKQNAMLFASDFDGTLSRNGRISLRNCRAIEVFRQNGGLFGICSGRDVQSLRAELRRQQVECDFYIYMNGTQIELRGQTLRQLGLQLEPAPVLARLQAAGALFVAVFGERELFIWVDMRHRERLLREGYLAYLDELRDAYRVRESLAEFSGKPLQISALLDSPERAQALTEELRGELSGCVLYPNCEYIDFVSPDTNKAEAVDFLRQALALSDEQVYVIGDGLNDLPMVERFHGFCMEESHPVLLAAAQQAFDEVADALLMLDEKGAR